MTLIAFEKCLIYDYFMFVQNEKLVHLLFFSICSDFMVVAIKQVIYLVGLTNILWCCSHKCMQLHMARMWLVLRHCIMVVFACVAEISDLIGHPEAKVISDERLPQLVRQMAVHADVGQGHGNTYLLCVNNEFTNVNLLSSQILLLLNRTLKHS